MRPSLALGVLGMLVVLGVGSASAAAATTRPRYIECASNDECGAWECCLLGPNRFSLPRCSPLSDVGDSCRPGGRGAETPVNVTVSYPDGKEVFLSAVHLIACPCNAGLQCDRAQGVCGVPVEHDSNAL